MSKEVDISTLNTGDKVVFTGFGDPENLPESQELLIPNEVYEILHIDPETEENGTKMEAMIEVGVANPDFDTSRKPSKKNPKNITFQIFSNEISLDGIPEDALEQDPEPEVVEEAAEPEVKKTTSVRKSAPKKKAAPKKKGTAKKPTKAVEPVQQEDETPDEDVEIGEEETPAPKKKAPTKKSAASKTVAKKKPATKKKVVEQQPEFDQEELDDTVNEPPLTKKTKAVAKKDSAPDEQYDEDRVLILEDDEEDQDILALVAEADDLIDLAQQEISDASLTEFRLGGVIYHVKRSRVWKDVEGGKYNRAKGWADFISDVLGMEYRKAMYLIDIYTKFSKYGISASEAAKMGWTKASVISSAMNAENAQALVDAAEEQTVTVLKETVKEMRATGNREVSTRVTFKFRLEQDAAVAVQEVLEMAKSALGTDRDDAQLFEHIVMEWGAEHLDVAKYQNVERKGK